MFRCKQWNLNNENKMAGELSPKFKMEYEMRLKDAHVFAVTGKATTPKPYQKMWMPQVLWTLPQMEGYVYVMEWNEVRPFLVPVESITYDKEKYSYNVQDGFPVLEGKTSKQYDMIQATPEVLEKFGFKLEDAEISISKF